MNLNAVLDVTIGLISVYLFLSLAASEIQELITTLFEWRAKHLKTSIINLLESDIATKLYENPLLQSMNQKAESRKDSKGPSYIPSEVFATALLEILKDSETKQKYELDLDGLENLDDFIKRLEKSEKLPASLKRNLSALAIRAKSKVRESKQEIQQLRQEIATWFDRSMERASGVYTRNAKGVALIIGLAIAILANADTVYIVKSLSHETTIRSTLNRVAEQVVVQHPEALTCLDNTVDRQEKFKCLASVKDSVNLVLEDISPLAIGWNLSEPFKKQFSPSLLRGLVEAVIGWVLSAVAIAMGAPFWFELLNKVINVRNAGKKPSSSTED